MSGDIDPDRAKFLVENAALCKEIAQNLGVYRLFRLRTKHKHGEP